MLFWGVMGGVGRCEMVGDLMECARLIVSPVHRASKKTDAFF